MAVRTVGTVWSCQLALRAWCLGTSGLALVGRITDIPASCGWAAGTSSREESSSVPCWLPRKEEGS